MYAHNFACVGIAQLIGTFIVFRPVPMVMRSKYLMSHCRSNWRTSNFQVSILNNSAEISMFTFPTSSLHYVTILEFLSRQRVDSPLWTRSTVGPRSWTVLKLESFSKTTQGSNILTQNFWVLHRGLMLQWCTVHGFLNWDSKSEF